MFAIPLVVAFDVALAFTFGLIFAVALVFAFKVCFGVAFGAPRAFSSAVTADPEFLLRCVAWCRRAQPKNCLPHRREPRRPIYMLHGDLAVVGHVRVATVVSGH